MGHLFEKMHATLDSQVPVGLGLLPPGGDQAEVFYMFIYAVFKLCIRFYTVGIFICFYTICELLGRTLFSGEPPFRLMHDGVLSEPPFRFRP